MIELQCTYCGKVFEKNPAEVERSTKRNNHFCCREHYDKYRGVREKATYECAQCGNSIIKSASLKDKRTNHFCSCKCYNKWRSIHLKGENNYNPKAKESKDVQCDYCNKDYRLPRYRLKIIKKHNFCSLGCKYAWHKKNNRVMVECDNCGGVVNKDFSQVKNNKNNFCSRECYIKWRAERKPKYICDVCNKEYSVSAGRYKNKAQHYCSTECLRKGYKGEGVYNYNSVDCVCGMCNKKFIKKRVFVEESNNDFCSRECYFEYRRTHAAPKAFLVNLRGLGVMRRWKKAVSKRDKGICQRCGDVKNIEIHHVVHFRDIINNNNIKTVEEALECKEIWDVENGMILCADCHADEHGDLFFMRYDKSKIKDNE